MLTIEPLPAVVIQHKDNWVSIGTQILSHFQCDFSISGIGKCIDCWKNDPCVPEEEMINGLGFTLGELMLARHGGTWVFVTDSFGRTPAIQRIANGSVTYALDAVSKRLRDNSHAEAELLSFAEVYSQCS
jgi:hypothetical protein